MMIAVLLQVIYRRSFMSKFVLSLPLVAFALLTACATSEPVAPAPGAVVVVPGTPVTSSSGVVTSPGASSGSSVIVPTTSALRAGFGRIDSVAAVPRLGSAAAGASTDEATKRVGLKMEDGTMQFIDTDAKDLSVGDRIEITRDGYLRRLAS
jgi:hypothetical protein